MRAFAFASAISLALAGAASGARRVASLNLCTDELLLMLGAPGQIVSVTHLAHKPAETPLWRQARRYPHNDGSLLSVVGLQPDLVADHGRRRARPGADRRSGSAFGCSICPFPKRWPTSSEHRRDRRRRPWAGRTPARPLLRPDRAR